MGFVVKLTTPTGTVCWLSAPTARGIRTLDTRTNAEVFETQEDARIAIERMPPEFVKGGSASFSIESAD
jgi:hypothetical protein